MLWKACSCRDAQNVGAEAQVGLLRLCCQPLQASRGSMDFVHDVLADGRRMRVFTFVDDYTRECLALEADTSISGQRVTRTLGQLREAGKLLQVLVCNNGTEFTSKVMLM